MAFAHTSFILRDPDAVFERTRPSHSRSVLPLIADACVTPHGTLWLAVGGPCTPGGLLVSGDAGRTFREVTRQDPRDPDAHHFYAVYALDDQHVWACGAAGEDDTAVVWRSADGGRFWEVLMAGDRARGLSPDVMFTQVLFTDASNGFLVCAGESLLTTRDGGRHWSELHVPGASPFGLYFLDERRGWLLSHDLDRHGHPLRTCVFTTLDGGRTWALREDDFAGLPALDVSGFHVDANGTGVLCGPEGMLLYARPERRARASSGVTWRFARGMVPCDLNFITRSPDGAVWVAGEHGTLLVSRDEGVSYTAVHTGTRAELHAVAFVDDPVVERTVGLALGAHGVLLRFDPRSPDALLRCATPWP